jgi:phenylacetaldehyde dehydrogenase
MLADSVQLNIGGSSRPAHSGETFDTIDPSTSKKLTNVAKAGKADVDEAVVVARRTFESGAWARATPAYRERVLLRFAELVEQNTDAIAQLDAIDAGAPLGTAVGAANRTAAHFRYFAGWATKLHGITIPVSTEDKWLNFTKREPIGVVASIIPWNTPIDNATWKLAAPLAAGCSVILKPAELTPLSADLLGRLLYEAGLPEGTLSILQGFGDVGAALASHDDVDKIAFTGSTAVGREIVRASAGNLKRVSLELGGKSPAIVFDDADLELTVPGVFNGLFYNAGQICCASSRVLVQEGIHDEFVAALIEHAKKVTLGGGFDDAQLGPVISEKQFERVADYVNIGITEGAKPVLGGEDAPLRDHPGYFIKPTIFTGVTSNMRIAQEEIFGPILGITRFASESELPVEANSNIYGLSASIWTRDIGRALRTTDVLRAGVIWVNGHSVLDPASPFGGWKQSGYGKELGFEVLNNYLNTKSVWMRY